MTPHPLDREEVALVILRPSIAACGALITVLAGGAAFQQPTSSSPEPIPQKEFPVKVESPHLPNAFRLHDKVISGGEPEGETGFQELQSLGVRTIISVDGAQPDVALAKKYGLRYVHLPFGYDGIPQKRIEELARAVRDLPGPIYIHCHHGKHRGPAAATAACVSVGFLEPDQVLGVLKTAGTSQNYQGLYRSAESARRIEDRLLDALPAEFKEAVKLPPLAEAMVAIDHTHDRLKAVAQAGWRADPEQPDLDPAHEALLLREHFTELLRTEEVQQRPSRFVQLARDTEHASAELERYLRNPPGNSTALVQRASQLLESVTANCTTCHGEFRDVPLDEQR
jgi:protein tyrosine phosphatase (PTP) superfamily phosphohydrolase (DUF442 family)